jgi:5-(aminomethyl)-3-furanmethanol phosphate kinase
MRSGELSAWLKSIESLSENSDVIIVPGGGEFADSVRSLQNIHGFDDHAAHRMALLAMCQYGYLLAGISQKLHLVENIELLLSSLGKNMPLLWLPTSLIEDDSEICASWNFTSDSIALWLATKLLATKLVLVKSKDLNLTNISILNHIKMNNLDKGFQELSKAYSGKIFFFEKSQYRQLIDLS